MTRSHIGEYVLHERIGGSRAAVHRAVQRATGRTVVVKTATWHRPAVTAALAREAAILERIVHPSLVRLVELVDDVDGRTLVLTNGAQGDLTRLLARDGAMDPSSAADVGARLAGALTALHDHGVVHRDVRPSNVVVDVELVPILCDLDHALDPSQPGLATDAEIVGDASHVDPRLFDGLPQGPAMDLFGLGSVVWAAATGGRERPDDLTAAAHDLPPTLLGAIDACLDGSIGDARAAAAAFSAAANEALSWRRSAAGPRIGARTGGGLPAPPSSPPPRQPRRAVHGHASRPPSREGTDGASRDGMGSRTSPRRPRVAALAGGGPGAATATRHWGTPPGAGVATPHAPTRAPGRRWWLIGGGVATLVAVVTAALFLWPGLLRPPGSTDVGTADGPVPVTPPPPCDDALPTGETPGRAAVLADTRGRGCSDVLELRDGVLVTGAGRFALGEPGDVLLAGDWDGDGRWSPAIYRPPTGELYLFDVSPTSGGEFTSRPAVTLAAGATPFVVATDDGRHEVVTGDDARR